MIDSMEGLRSSAALAQLGERQTEDLKAPCSIHGGGTFLLPTDNCFLCTYDRCSPLLSMRMLKLSVRLRLIFRLFHLSSVCIYFMTDNKYWTSANWRTGYNPIFSQVVTRFSGRPVTHMLNRFKIQKKSNSLKWTPYGPTRNEFHTSYSSFVIHAIDNRINCGLSVRYIW